MDDGCSLGNQHDVGLDDLDSSAMKKKATRVVMSFHKLRDCKL